MTSSPDSPDVDTPALSKTHRSRAVPRGRPTTYYNGYVYSFDMERGPDVIRLDDPRLRPAGNVTYDEFNRQSQPVFRPGR